MGAAKRMDFDESLTARMRVVCANGSDVVSRFWAKVLRTDDPNSCWLWTGRCNENGYGRIHVHGRGLVGAHRWSYEHHLGAIPVGMHVLHRCDVRNCVRPDHLFLGTHADNMRDAATKGRLVQRFAWKGASTCVRGHVLAEVGVVYRKGRNGRTDRTCRLCQNERARADRARRKAQRLATEVSA